MQKKKNPEGKKETCISFIERTRSEFCTILKKEITLTNTVLMEKTSKIVKKFPKKSIIKKPSLIENIAKNSVIYNRR